MLNQFMFGSLGLSMTSCRCFMKILFSISFEASRSRDLCSDMILNDNGCAISFVYLANCLDYRPSTICLISLIAIFLLPNSTLVFKGLYWVGIFFARSDCSFASAEVLILSVLGGLTIFGSVRGFISLGSLQQMNLSCMNT